MIFRQQMQSNVYITVTHALTAIINGMMISRGVDCTITDGEEISIQSRTHLVDTASGERGVRIYTSPSTATEKKQGNVKTTAEGELRKKGRQKREKGKD